jgi:hypothetical protein
MLSGNVFCSPAARLNVASNGGVGALHRNSYIQLQKFRMTILSAAVTFTNVVSG